MINEPAYQGLHKPSFQGINEPFFHGAKAYQTPRRLAFQEPTELGDLVPRRLLRQAPSMPWNLGDRPRRRMQLGVARGRNPRPPATGPHPPGETPHDRLRAESSGRDPTTPWASRNPCTKPPSRQDKLRPRQNWQLETLVPRNLHRLAADSASRLDNQGPSCDLLDKSPWSQDA